ncbi:MAG: hypothetical protein JO157_02490, partial [Acetobacteraceae bacterium]|nr:hypothetical protein [Acetobacteraceae bacterium]
LLCATQRSGAARAVLGAALAGGLVDTPALPEVAAARALLATLPHEAAVAGR